MKVPRLLLVSLMLLGACTPQGIFNSSASDASITIAYAEPLSSFSPFSYEATNRKYLANIYEPLVSFDSTFNTETALAVSWGRMDETTWDFHLREGVFFHDGSSFDADDVLYSFKQAQSWETSELSALLGTLVSITKVDAHRVQIETQRPDPLLLNKLTYVPMVPQGYMNFNLPIGTGPYRMAQFQDDTLVLERFEEYWGPLAYFKKAQLRYSASLEDRVTALLNNEVQVLANVPPQYVSTLEDSGISVAKFPSLEVSYLMLNTKGPFSDPALRAAVWHALSSDYAETLGGGYLLETSQVAAKGITGYLGNAQQREQNLQKAEEYRAASAETINLTLDLPSGLDTLGEAIKNDLAQINIAVTVNVLPPKDLEAKILSGTSDFYFFGWKFDLADSSDFFESVAHTQQGGYGTFNGIHYSNVELDREIEAAGSHLDSSSRKTQLQRASELLLADQVLIPLFESQVLYGLRPEVYYDFRLDGLVLASKIVENVVE